MRIPFRSLLPLAAVAALGSGASTAQAFDYSGYFRAGPGATKKDASRACYGLQGSGLKYRLGNECDFYGEFVLGHDAKVDGVDVRAALMMDIYNPGTDNGDSRFGAAQMYVETKGLDVAPAATFWVGKRYYGRADVHIVDTNFVKMDGVGAGAYGFDAGVGKFGLAYFKTDGTDQPGNRLNAELADVAANTDGKLRFVATYVDGNFTGGKSGFGFTVQHNQDKFLGGSNTLWLQLAQGSAGLDGNFGNLTAGSESKSVRIVESFTWQAGPFGGQALALLQNDDNDGQKTRSYTIGGRASYAFTRNFKLVTELGHSEKKPDGSAAQKLTKLTLAPTLATGPGFWNRPELRLYVTTAKWNDAANAAAGAGGVTGIGDDKTSGTSYGAQVEIWF